MFWWWGGGRVTVLMASYRAMQSIGSPSIATKHSCGFTTAFQQSSMMPSCIWTPCRNWEDGGSYHLLIHPSVCPSVHPFVLPSFPPSLPSLPSLRPSLRPSAAPPYVHPSVCSSLLSSSTILPGPFYIQEVVSRRLMGDTHAVLDQLSSTGQYAWTAESTRINTVPIAARN